MDHFRSGVWDSSGQHDELPSLLKIRKNEPNVVVHSYSPSYSGGLGRRISWTLEAEPVIPALWEAEISGWPEVRSSRPSWPTWWNPVSTKNTKTSWAWWQVPVIPATQEADERAPLEPRRRRVQWAKIVPLHSSLGHRVRLCLKKKVTLFQRCFFKRKWQD